MKKRRSEEVAVTERGTSRREKMKGQRIGAMERKAGGERKKRDNNHLTRANV